MAFIKSKKLYAILMGSEEGKDIVKDAPELSEEELQNRIDKFMGSSGSSSIKNTDSDEEDEVKENKSFDTKEELVDYVKKGGFEEKKSIEQLQEERKQAIKDYNKTGDEKFSQKEKELEKQIDDLKSKKFDEHREEENQVDYEEAKTKFSDNGYKKPEVKDYSHIKNEKKKLDTIVGDVSHYTSDKSYDVLDFRNTLEKNGFKVDYIENKSGTWRDRNGEKHKEYDIKLEDGNHIYFDLIADENYDTKEVIAYKNGKGW